MQKSKMTDKPSSNDDISINPSDNNTLRGQKKKWRPRNKRQLNYRKKKLNEEQAKDECIICMNPIEFYAIGECNHQDICSHCLFRMRCLLKQRDCPICQQDMKRAIITKEKKLYKSFNIWDDSFGGPGIEYDDASQLFFSQCKQHYLDLISLRSFRCRHPSCNFLASSLPNLEVHLKESHGLQYCSLCREHQYFFIQEQVVYTKHALKKHQSQGDQVKSKSQLLDYHPLCRFCSVRYFSSVELFHHLEKDHFRCHLCTVEDKKKENENRYYKSYADLEHHFRSSHHLCEDHKCLENKFVVFISSEEYKQHLVMEHLEREPQMLFNFKYSSKEDNDFTISSSCEDTSFWSVGTRSTRNQGSWSGVTGVEEFPALPATSENVVPFLHTQSNVKTRKSQSVKHSTQQDMRLQRNRNLKDALGLHDSSISTDLLPRFTDELILWGSLNLHTLARIEEKLHKLLEDPLQTSVQLRPMPAAQRKLVHELAAYYGLKTESFDSEPKRYVSLIKSFNSQEPFKLLSTTIKERKKDDMDRKKRAQQIIHMNRVSGTANRGWEGSFVPPPKSNVPDSWSDEEAERIEDNSLEQSVIMSLQKITNEWTNEDQYEIEEKSPE